jgi:hypothetical protein
VTVSEIPVGQILFFFLSYYFQRKLFLTALIAKGIVLTNTVIDEIKEALKRRREYHQESLRDYDTEGIHLGDES